MKTHIPLKGIIALCLAAAVLPPQGLAQSPQVYPSPARSAPLLTAAQLQDLVGRFALYPDDLVALILPASTTPLEIVKAQRFLNKHATDKSLKPDPSLSEPVMNLLTYPDVVNVMGDDLDWTQVLGEAVTTQQLDVLSAIQIFRRKAQSAGNLKSDDKLTIIVKQEVVKIVPTQPEVIYVPQYKPATVIVTQSAPVVTYAPTAYPVYYHPGAAVAVAATIGYIAGANNAYGCNWYSGSIYHAPRVAHYGHIQDERMDYANNAREDWQDYGKASREDWQNHANDAQSKRQKSASDNQSQRQDSVRDTTSSNQGQRQQAASGAQASSQQSQANRQSAAQSRQSSGSPAKDGQNWQPSAQTRPASTSGANRSSGASAQQRPASSPSKFGSAKTGGSPTGAYGGASSGARAQTQSARGARSMSGTSRGGGGGGGKEGRARGR